MLLCTKNHFIRSLTSTLSGKEGPGSAEERVNLAQERNQRIKDYASDETGRRPGVCVLAWTEPRPVTKNGAALGAGSYTIMVEGVRPKPGQRIVYVDGGFDLFSSGHIEFLRQVVKAEEALGRQAGCDYGPAYVVAGVHDDEVINYWKGVNYPIMNILERGLCVLQCRYVNSVIFSAPFIPSKAFLKGLAFGTPDAIYHGPTAFMPLTYDPYVAAREMGIYREIGNHSFQNVNAGEIVQRILQNRQLYEERQKKKGEKAVGEHAVHLRERMEEEAAALEKERALHRRICSGYG
ncbi:MAG: hypothetical protein Q9210_006903 [Variospora velana]